jgi:hypothetical protein
VQLRRSPHAHFRDGFRVAALKAFRAARFYISEQPVTLKQAALCHGTNVAYVQAAIKVLKANEPDLVDRILVGEISLQVVAKLLAPQVKAIEALKTSSWVNLRAIFTATGFTNDLSTMLPNSSPAELAAAGRAFGNPDVLFDQMIAPLLVKPAA